MYKFNVYRYKKMRLAAWILVFCMLFESAALPVTASDISCGVFSQTDESIDEGSTDTYGEDADSSGENSTDASGENADSSGESNTDASGEGADSSDENNNDASGEAADSSDDNNNGASGEENSSPDGSADDDENGGESPAEGEDSNSDDSENSENIDDNTNIDDEGDTDSVDEEDESSLTDDADDETDSVSDDIAAAEEAFADILEQKDVMALIYLTDSYNVRNEADEKGSVIAGLESGHTVYLRGVTITPEKLWFRVSFYFQGSEMEGYVERKYLAYSDEDWIAWDNKYLKPLISDKKVKAAAAQDVNAYAVSYEDVEKFPAGYQSALKQLKSQHPNWTFVPMNTKLDFATAVTSEMGVKSLIQNTTSNASKGWVGEPCPSESGWYFAKRDAVSYYMDPRNFLTETYIFQFEQLTFNASYHTEAAIQTFLNSTFMKGVLSDDAQKRTYARAFYEIGSSRKLSPFHLASRVYQEQGQGNSGMISGTYPGYEGYYNYFNVDVNGKTDAEKIVKGLTYAKKMGWNTRYKSLEGGAATIGNNYILKLQDTLYLEKFNVDSNSPYGLYNHQYMQNIQAPASESSTTRKMYDGTGSLSSAFVFKIPVYNNMPGLKLNKTNITLNKGDKITLTASVNETNLDGKSVTWKSSNTTVAVVADGVVSAMNAGTAVITAAYDGNEADCTILVVNHLKQITLDKETLTLRRPDTVVEDTTGLSLEEIESNTSTAELKVSFDPEDTTDDKTIVWSSSNKKAAVVNDGVITAVGIGETTITAKASKAGNQTAKCKVKVIAPVYKIEFSSDNNTDKILAGQGINLSVEYLPLDTTSDTTVSWKSSDTSVATVTRTKGSVKGISAGKAYITASVGGYSASHEITVENCTLTFMDKDNTTKLKTISTVYGGKIPQSDFPVMNDTDDALFAGWYTNIDGTGSKFNPDTFIHQKETVVFPYYAGQGKGFYVIPVGDQTYTGSAIKPEVLVYDSVSYDNGDRNLVPLELNKDYTVSYKNNKKAAADNSAKAPSIIVKGKGNYAGTETITFNIVPKALTDTDITVDDAASAYSGKIIKGRPTIYRGGKKLTLNTDYKLAYPQTGTGAYRNAGTYPIIITGIGGYTGSLTAYGIITPKILLSKVSIAKIPNQSYDPELIDKEKGTGIEPPLTVTYKKKPLLESKDGGITGNYVVTYKNNLKTGTATATITAADNDENPYMGSKSVTFKITAASISKAVITGIGQKTYTGSEEDVKQSGISVSLGGKTLQESSDNGETGDYLLEYKNIGRAGTATVIIKGINKYTGAKKKTYKITACDLSQIKSDIAFSYCTEDKDSDNPDNIAAINSLNDIVTPYVKGGAKPKVFLTYKGEELTLGKDYTVKYKNNNAVTTANMAENKRPMITVTGKGLYKGKISGSFSITDGAMSEEGGKITMTAKDIVYKAKKGAYKTVVTLTDVNGKKLQAGKDYGKMFKYTYVNQTDITAAQGGKISRNAGDEVNETDIPNVGTAIRVTVTGAGNYAGAGASSSVSAVYHIVSADISKAKVSVKPKTYNDGNKVTLSEDDITVTLGGTVLNIGKDYEIDEKTYTNNRNKGKASVTIKGCGANYGGTKKISFNIKGKNIFGISKK